MLNFCYMAINCSDDMYKAYDIDSEDDWFLKD